jgi:hypothetical protein
MANKLYEETDIQNIANAIREKAGTADTFKVSEMANAVANIQTGSVEKDVFTYQLIDTVTVE